MALKRMVMQLGMGTDIRGGDYTKAACRAVSAAIRQNSLSIAGAFDLPREAMQIKVTIGVASPAEVDKTAVAAVLPYGNVEVIVTEGGMDMPRDNSTDGTILANAAVVVYLDLPDNKTYGSAA